MLSTDPPERPAPEQSGYGDLFRELFLQSSRNCEQAIGVGVTLYMGKLLLITACCRIGSKVPKS